MGGRGGGADARFAPARCVTLHHPAPCPRSPSGSRQTESTHQMRTQAPQASLERKSCSGRAAGTRVRWGGVGVQLEGWRQGELHTSMRSLPFSPAPCSPLPPRPRTHKECAKKVRQVPHAAGPPGRIKAAHVPVAAAAVSGARVWVGQVAERRPRTAAGVPFLCTDTVPTPWRCARSRGTAACWAALSGGMAKLGGGSSREMREAARVAGGGEVK